MKIKFGAVKIKTIKSKGGPKIIKSKIKLPFTIEQVITKEITWLYDGGFANSTYLDTQIIDAGRA